MSPRIEPGRWVYFAIATAIVAADQATKIAAHARLRGHGAIEVVPGFFDLSYSRNPGGLFGYFGNLEAHWRVALLTALPLLAVGLIAWFLGRGDDSDRRTLYGLACILGGAVGNLIDRIFRGEVVDFLDVYVSWRPAADWLVGRFGTAHWPTFNLADSAIVTGAGLLLLTIVRPPATEAGRSPADPS